VSIRTRGSFRPLVLILTLFDDVDDDDDVADDGALVVVEVDVPILERSSLDTISVAYLPLLLFTSSLSNRFKYLESFRYRNTKLAMVAKSFPLPPLMSSFVVRLPAKPSSVSRLVGSVAVPNRALDT